MVQQYGSSPEEGARAIRSQYSTNACLDRQHSRSIADPRRRGDVTSSVMAITISPFSWAFKVRVNVAPAHCSLIIAGDVLGLSADRWSLVLLAAERLEQLRRRRGTAGDYAGLCGRLGGGRDQLRARQMGTGHGACVAAFGSNEGCFGALRGDIYQYCLGKAESSRLKCCNNWPSAVVAATISPGMVCSRIVYQ